jgi:ubiquinone/menaquinone biosynthesis C-methylase UbiE
MLQWIEIEKSLREKGISPGVGFSSPNIHLKWCNLLIKGIGESFKEGLSLIDWGCGCGRFAHRMNDSLENFSYYGFDTNTEYGNSILEYAKEVSSGLSSDNKVIEFTTTDDMEIVNKAYGLSSIILAADVFTYYNGRQVKLYIDSIKEFLDTENNSIVFSMLKRSNREPLKVYAKNSRWDVPESYTYYSHSDKEIAAIAKGRNLEEIADIDGGGFIHTVFRMS